MLMPMLKDIAWIVGIFSVGAALVYPLNFTLFTLLDTPVPYLISATYGLLAGLCEILGCRTRSTFVAGAVLPPLVPLFLSTHLKLPDGQPSEGAFIFSAAMLAMMIPAPIGWVLGFGISRIVNKLRKRAASMR